MSEEKDPVKDFQLNELERIRERSRPVDAFSIALVGVVVVAVVLSLYYYRTAFAGGLSHQTDDWSAFGTFIGGVFGPLVSFVTLIAILRTIWLQRELLETQRYEFDAMQQLQTKTLASQLTQIERANADADRRVVEETRLNILKILDNFHSALNAEYETKRRGYEQYYQWIMDKKTTPKIDEVEGMRNKLRDYEKRLASLTMLYSDLCLEEFRDVATIKARYESGLQKIWAEWPSNTCDDVQP
ncbi:hypothetical protein [Pseudomonas sp. NC02]|uniref:hypothetical protein n=1 Tax=Pseudomonas sp. NC02 TaxID=2067572 RepID=UPI000C816F98|nr:hypothetical protein [Pseudomonas sp. NC02]AUO22491.1 hypothetical protein C0058_10995 [Pseudomonas sp. NC02]